MRSLQIKSKKVKDAVNHIIFTHPFYASILLQQEIIEDASCKTFYVDGVRLGYNGEFAESLSFDEVVGILIHEIKHLVFMHHIRMNKREHGDWNKAADYAINPLVKDAGFKLPSKVLLDDQYRNMTAEDIYNKLQVKKQQQQQQQKQSQPSNNGGQGQNNPSQGQPSNQQGQPNNQSGQGQKGQAGNPSNQSGNNPSDEDGEDSCGEVRQAADVKKAEENIKIQVKQAVALAKMAGKLPSDEILKIIGDAHKSKYDWRTLLNRFMSDVTAQDYSFERPDNRFLNRGIILPDLYSKTVGNIIFAVDTSGSISLDEVKIVIDEVRACLDMMSEDRGASTELRVVYCDAAVQGVDIINDSSDVVNPKGGGGTAFGPVFKYVQDNDLKPTALVYITDGYCHDFGNIIPDYPVLWCVTTDYDMKNPFGELIRVDFHI